MTQLYFEKLLADGDGKGGFRSFFTLANNKEEILRALAAESMERGRGSVPLKTFEIVGGVKLDYDKRSDLDANRFYDIFLYLLRTGIPIHPEFTVHASNLLYEEDYLKTDRKSDVTIISYVPLETDYSDKPGQKEAYRSSLTYVDLDSNSLNAAFLRAKHEFTKRASTDRIAHAVGNRLVSSRNTVANWRERLGKSESKLVFSMYNHYEVDLRLVKPDGFNELGSIMASYEFDPTQLRDVKSTGGGYWQVIGNNDFIELVVSKIRTHVTPESGIKHRDPTQVGTELGTNIYSAAMGLFEEAMDKAQREEAEKRLKAKAKKGPKSEPEQS